MINLGGAGGGGHDSSSITRTPNAKKRFCNESVVVGSGGGGSSGSVARSIGMWLRVMVLINVSSGFALVDRLFVFHGLFQSDLGTHDFRLQVERATLLGIVEFIELFEFLLVQQPAASESVC
jgi:hypothetical protein